MPGRTLQRVVFSCVAVAALAACEREGSPPDVATPPAEAPIPAEPVARERAGRDAGCDALPSADELRRLLREAPDRGDAGGLFGGRKEWAALVNRQGEVCAVVASTDDPAASWPGSQHIAKAKAYTANAFSTDDSPLSTARLYTMAQPGQALYGLAAGNPYDPDCLATPEDHDDAERRLCGGTITFGGGVALYRDGIRIGGLGASGDTACADHEIAKRIRDSAGLNPPAGAAADDITYRETDGATVFAHPLCPNTWRNGERVPTEEPAPGP